MPRFFMKLTILALLVAGCSQDAKWTIQDQHYYWNTGEIMVDQLKPSNHILLIVDDSGTMATKVTKVKAALDTFVNELKGTNLDYYIHLLLLSEINQADVLQ